MHSDMAADLNRVDLRLIAELWDAAGVYQLGRDRVPGRAVVILVRADEGAEIRG